MAKEYNISRTSGVCQACGRTIEPREAYYATVREQDSEIVRQDYCLECWPEHQPADEAQLLGLWRGQVPVPTEKKKTFVDDEVLINFFSRLEGSDEPARQSFRYVLALVLMRKKLLVYDRGEKNDAGQDVWLMHIKGSTQTHHVVDPGMDEEKIAEVSGQLGAILEGQL
jgi:hypothetical protein